MIEIKNLKKSFNGNLVLDDINLTIEKNDIFGLLGVSGAGKSTLLDVSMVLKHLIKVT